MTLLSYLPFVSLAMGLALACRVIKIKVYDGFFFAFINLIVCAFSLAPLGVIFLYNEGWLLDFMMVYFDWWQILFVAGVILFYELIVGTFLTSRIFGRSYRWGLKFYCLTLLLAGLFTGLTVLIMRG
jgi:hypothetical protein